jgi:hypothetical protein
MTQLQAWISQTVARSGYRSAFAARETEVDLLTCGVGLEEVGDAHGVAGRAWDIGDFAVADGVQQSLEWVVFRGSYCPHVVVAVVTAIIDHLTLIIRF